MIKRSLLQLLALVILTGCASNSGYRKVSGHSVDNAAAVDSIYARRFVLEDFDQRLASAKNFHSTGNYYLFRSVRDSLIIDVNAYIRGNAHTENDADFTRLLTQLSILDTLYTPTSQSFEDEGFITVDDSLALQFADWPEIDIELDDGVMFDKYNSHFPELENNRIDFWIKYFTGPGKARFERSVYRMQIYRPTVERILDEMGLPRELLCLALIESGYSMKAVSYASAVGPWQFIRGTARIYKLRNDWWFDERRDIVASTYAAGHYLNDLHGIWDDWFLAFAAYNCGEYRVARQIGRQRTNNFWQLQLPRQTQRYVPKFLAALYILRDPEKYGIKIPMVDPIVFDEVTITDATDLSLIAESAETTVDVIKELNPQLRRWATPPKMEIVLRVPRGKGELCAANLEKIPPSQRITYRRHTVRKGETLSAIANKYGTSITALRRLNSISNKHFIREGKSLLVPMQGAQYAAASSSVSKPGYKDDTRSIDKKSLERYAAKSAPPKGHKRLTYVVKDGDTLGEIAEQFHTSARRLRSWNNLSYRRFIYPGQKLAIYVKESYKVAPDMVASTSVATPDETCCLKKVHKVRKGDTMYSISKSYGVRLADLLAWNNKRSRSVIRPGEAVTVWVKRNS